MNDLNLIAINLTRRCNLSCKHCYLDATTLKFGTDNELSTSEVKDILQQVSQLNSAAMVVLTGGEPLLRDDLESIIEFGSQLGLFIVAGTNGVQLTQKRVRSLKTAGLMGLGVSIDSVNPARHDEFRGRDGSWAKTMKGLEYCREEDLSFQIHFTVTRMNHDEIDDIIKLSEALGARIVNIFFLICTGRGETASDLLPSEYTSSLKNIIKAQSDYPDLIIRPRCAPHFKRIAMQLNPEADINRIDGREGDGCLAGIHYCRIDSEGQVTACPYIDLPAGNIRQQSFNDIWHNSSQFQSLRNPSLTGKCGRCEYRSICGGCRARPVADGDSIMDSDPLCDYVPEGRPVIIPLADLSATEISWSDDALVRLNRIPGFIRKMVKKRAEAYVMDQKGSIVTTTHLEELTARRFGNKRPARPNINSGKDDSRTTDTKSVKQ